MEIKNIEGSLEIFYVNNGSELSYPHLSSEYYESQEEWIKEILQEMTPIYKKISFLNSLNSLKSFKELRRERKEKYQKKLNHLFNSFSPCYFKNKVSTETEIIKSDIFAATVGFYKREVKVSTTPKYTREHYNIGVFGDFPETHTEIIISPFILNYQTSSKTMKQVLEEYMDDNLKRLFIEKRKEKIQEAERTFKKSKEIIKKRREFFTYLDNLHTSNKHDNSKKQEGKRKIDDSERIDLSKIKGDR